MEAFLGRKVARIAGDARPVQHRHVDRVVAGRAFHHGQLASRIVLDTPQAFPVLRPGEHVAVAAHGQHAFRVGLVQVHFHPFPVYCVAAAVPGKGEHVPGGLLHVLQHRPRIVDEDILRIDVVAGEQQPYGGGEREAAVAAVRGHPPVAHVGAHLAGKVIRCGEGVQAQPLVSDAHPVRLQADVFQHRLPAFRGKGQVAFHQPRTLFRARDFFRRQAAQAHMPRVVDNPFELFHRLHETGGGLLVRHFFGQDMPPAQGAEVAVPAAPLPHGLGHVEVAAVVQVGALVEVAFITPCQEAHLPTFPVRPVALFREPVLLAHDGIVGQHPDGLHPHGVDSFVFPGRHGVHLGQRHLEGDRQVRVLRHDAAVLYGKQGEFPFQCLSFQYGTPFNLLDDFKEDEIYTWDYVMEQRAKASWDLTHFGDPNPYASLPTMNIYTYDLGRLLHEFVDEDVAFNFREFFRVNEVGNFIHEKDVSAFLNLLTEEDKDSCYPFANEEYRNIFRHTLWMLPGVKEARAMSTLLQSHPVFQHFKVVNVAGDGDEDEESKDALAAVEEAIGKDPDATRTITLSCGRLTTGVSVKAWTGVFMLSGSYNTAASSYMQTIFRVQTPATINGRVKEQCYVFDFAPDRTLKVIAETAKISSKAGKTSGNDRKIMGEFLNFCPIISIEGSKMSQFDVPKMLEQLKRVYVERVVRNGFEDKSLYNDELMKLGDLELQEFDDLKKIIGQTKAMPKTNQVDINNQGLTDEQYQELEDLEKKSKKRGKDKQPLTDEEKKRLEELKKKKNNREAAISILRGISIRMPLLIYGAELSDESQDITIDNFASLIDPQSWEEFMPKGVTKQKFNSIKNTMTRKYSVRQASASVP